MRPGEIALETGDENAALRHMPDAYTAERRENFEERGSVLIIGAKYCDFLRTHTDPTVINSKNSIIIG